MGRTWRTFNDQLELEQESWRPFRTALRREDQAVFDRLFVLAKRHMAEAQNACRPVTFETVTMCVLVELMKELDRLHAHDP
jgi:hypothetical protein